MMPVSYRLSPRRKWSSDTKLVAYDIQKRAPDDRRATYAKLAKLPYNLRKAVAKEARHNRRRNYLRIVDQTSSKARNVSMTLRHRVA